MDRSYNSPYDTDTDHLPEREISLGTSTILGIFFALALVCAVFFGFGYSMGRRSSTPAVAAAHRNARSRNHRPQATPQEAP